MGMTPEGKVKKIVKQILDGYAPWVYYRMPVTNGMGVPGLDFYGSCCGLHFEIETKAKGDDLTPRQKITTGEVEASMGKVFVIRSTDPVEFAYLRLWLAAVINQHRRVQ